MTTNIAITDKTLYSIDHHYEAVFIYQGKKYEVDFTEYCGTDGTVDNISLNLILEDKDVMTALQRRIKMHESIFLVYTGTSPVRCFYCDGTSQMDVPQSSGFPAGRGAQKAWCRFCKMWTFFDYREEVRTDA